MLIALFLSSFSDNCKLLFFYFFYVEIHMLYSLILLQEGSSNDRGLYARCFEELFDLANSDSSSTSRFKFSVTVAELYNEQVCYLFFFFSLFFLLLGLKCPASRFSLFDSHLKMELPSCYDAIPIMF